MCDYAIPYPAKERTYGAELAGIMWVYPFITCYETLDRRYMYLWTSISHDKAHVLYSITPWRKHRAAIDRHLSNQRLTTSSADIDKEVDHLSFLHTLLHRQALYCTYRSTRALET